MKGHCQPVSTSAQGQSVGRRPARLGACARSLETQPRWRWVEARERKDVVCRTAKEPVPGCDFGLCVCFPLFQLCCKIQPFDMFICCCLHFWKQISSRKNSLVAAPSTVSNKIKVPAPQPIVKKDKRQNSSRFSASNSRELQKLPSLKGKFYDSSFKR